MGIGGRRGRGRGLWTTEALGVVVGLGGCGGVVAAFAAAMRIYLCKTIITVTELSWQSSKNRESEGTEDYYQQGCSGQSH